jgi:hypothetical protein
MVKFAFTVSWLPDAMDMVAHAAFAVTVTVRLPSITALSPATGALAPLEPPDVADHVEVEFQLPLATEYRDAAVAPDPMARMRVNVKRNRKPQLFIRLTMERRILTLTERNKAPERTKKDWFSTMTGVIRIYYFLG